jgi:hypothetical protein
MPEIATEGLSECIGDLSPADVATLLNAVCAQFSRHFRKPGFIGGGHDHGMPCDPPNGPAVLVGEGYSWFASQSLANVFAQPICKAAGTS